MNKIDLSKYQTTDFGFTAVDEIDEIPREPQPTQPVNVANTDDISGPILERLEHLEQVVGSVIDILGRIEQASTPNFDTEEYKTLIEKDVKEKLQLVESMVMPLLTNLLKDADTKDYIKWPNRGPTIEKFMEKFLAVTRD
ncbi:MAG: hypothetical protein EBU90_25240 [Proteobacteria bacterium]|nr:hypothetical protein [Pseudomonadota bacterium]